MLILDEPGNDLDTDMLAVVVTCWTPGRCAASGHATAMGASPPWVAVGNGSPSSAGGVDEYLGRPTLPLFHGGRQSARQRPARRRFGLIWDEASPVRKLPPLGGEQRTCARNRRARNERETLNGKIEACASMAAADPTDFTALGDFKPDFRSPNSRSMPLRRMVEAAEKLGSSYRVLLNGTGRTGLLTMSCRWLVMCGRALWPTRPDDALGPNARLRLPMFICLTMPSASATALTVLPSALI